MFIFSNFSHIHILYLEVIITIPNAPIWIQVWSLFDINVSLFNFSIQGSFGVSTAHEKIPLFCCCIRKKMSLVQRFLLYSNDRGRTRCPSEFSPKYIFTELGRVHSSSTWANNFKPSLLQSLKYLQNSIRKRFCKSNKNKIKMPPPISPSFRIQGTRRCMGYHRKKG